MKQYIVDAFTDKLFAGNPAAVCVLDRWPSDELMQSIAIENNFSETAFTVCEPDGAYRLRWFTPGGEIDLCGHATLGTAFVIANYIEPDLDRIVFCAQVGELPVEVPDGVFEMDFPAYVLRPIAVTDAMEDALGARPLEAYLDRDLLLVMDSERTVGRLQTDMEKVKKLDGLLVAVTARGSRYDCVSRVFAPKLGVKEDPVTGSAHCVIAPYWARRLNKNTLTAYQASARTGILRIEVCGERVKIAGTAVLFAESELHI